MSFKLTDTPKALPGSCKYCGSASRKFYIDTGMHEEFHGRVYICVDECLREMVQLTGFITPEQAAKNEVRLREALETLEKREKTIKGMEQIINGYQLSFDDFIADDPRTDDPDSDGTVDVEESVSEDRGNSDEGERESEGGSKAGKKRASESDSSGKLARVRPAPELPNLI